LENKLKADKQLRRQDLDDDMTISEIRDETTSKKQKTIPVNEDESDSETQSDPDFVIKPRKTKQIMNRREENSDDDFENPPKQIKNTMKKTSEIPERKQKNKKKAQHADSDDSGNESERNIKNKDKKAPKKVPIERTFFGFINKNLTLRHSIDNLQSRINKLTDAQKKDVQEMGFGSLLKMNIDSSPNVLGMLYKLRMYT
jgi:hypothetical protein